VRPRQRDTAFLRIAALAAAGGVSAIVFSIGLPIWQHAHGHPYTPVFSLFAGWGVAALLGAYACLRTYFLSDTPPRGPGGGVALALVAATREPRVSRQGPDERTSRAA
jgi:hypothetical protein